MYSVGPPSRPNQQRVQLVVGFAERLLSDSQTRSVALALRLAAIKDLTARRP
jgi:hypothetical protein